jgi:dethiobiotin synthetase
MMQKRFFITATGTGIGKSFITAALVRQAHAGKHSVMAYKPVISGFDPAQAADSDTGLLLAALSLPPTPQNVECISPWRFREPLAPSMAARIEKSELDFTQLADTTRAMTAGTEDVVLIEGVGGVMVPLDDSHTVIDWIAELKIPALLVAGNYLGTLSHTLTALEALEIRRIPVGAIIINESENDAVDLNATRDELARRIDVRLLTVHRNDNGEGLRVLFD